jgi:hypothetical protein
MSQALIRAALEQKLATWAAANSLPVQWQNTVLDPEPAAYVRGLLLPAQQDVPDVQSLGRTYRGIWQVSIVRPIGEGPGPAEALAASLSTAFTPSAAITSGGMLIFLLGPLSPAPPINEPGRFVVPCSQVYQSTVY